MTSAPSTAWTILKVLRWSCSYLEARGVSEPRPSAEVLLAHCLGGSRLDLYLHYDQPLGENELSCYKKLLKRRLAHEPTQYITGRQEFWSLDFLVTPAVLIPRPETELLVEVAAAYLQGQRAEETSVRLIDVGTGSGVLAVVLAKEHPQAQVTALDQSWEALCLARQNARRHGVEERIRFIMGDLLAALRPEAQFDLIVSNAPYVPTAEWLCLPSDIKDYEPRLALDGGVDGLDVIRRLVQAAPGYLKAGGLLALEVGQGQSAAVEQLLAHGGAFTPAEIRRDFQYIPRVVSARRLN